MKGILLFSTYWLLQTMDQVNFPLNFYTVFCYCGESVSHNRNSRINLQIISMYFFSDAMNGYSQKVSVCCLLPRYLSLNNLTWVDKAQSTQSNYFRIPLKSQEYKITLRYFGDINILLDLKDWYWGYFFVWLERSCMIQLVQSDSTLEKDLLPIFFPQRKTEAKKTWLV